MSQTMGELFARVAALTFFISTIKQLLPAKFFDFLESLWSKMSSSFHPYIEISFDEYTNSRYKNSAYQDVKTYLGTKSSNQAKSLKAEKYRKSKSIIISLDTGEEIVDEFEGMKLKWEAQQEKIYDSSHHRNQPLEKNSYVLTFHKKDRDVVTTKYLEYVMLEGKAIANRNKKRKLYTNRSDGEGSWDYINFEHPANFNTIGMDPAKKQEIIDDLEAFKSGKDYYASIGKAWKRGYLLYGPPGTGKSTMVCAIANFLDYDVYDLELTSLQNNSELKQLLIDTKGKSVVVIEDIDCSIDLTGKRNKSGNSTHKNRDVGKDKDSDEEDNDDKKSRNKVTLSGLLNVIDGIWSACSQGRIVIFTTNHVNKLDPALIRRGRMDKHIEMSYCRYKAFKVLAKNYLGIDTHPLFEEIEKLLNETNVSPCDVAENLMPKTDPKDVEACLRSVIEACQAAKQSQSKTRKVEAKKAKSCSRCSKLQK